jgi:hypothetical protein
MREKVRENGEETIKNGRDERDSRQNPIRLKSRNCGGRNK